MNGVGENFTYDQLNRVTGSGYWSGTGNQTIGYDAEGDITTKSDVGTYNYPAAGTAQPHAVQSITRTVNSGSKNSKNSGTLY